MARRDKGVLGHLAGSGAALALMAFVVAVFASLLVYLGQEASQFATLRAAVSLPILLILGVGSLLFLITIMVSVLQGFGLTDPRRAFGLPDGSMQAVIALSLVLIFVISSLYLYSSLPEKVTETDLRATEDRLDFAQQLLTTVGTLAVAVAGFYFGARSVGDATRAVRGEGAAAEVRVVEPTSPHTLGSEQVEVAPIRVETRPSGQRVVGYVAEGDDEGVVERLPSGEFRYRRGPTAQDVVRLAFQLPDGSARAELEIRRA